MSELYFYLVMSLMLILSFLIGFLVLASAFLKRIKSVALNMPCEAKNEG